MQNRGLKTLIIGTALVPSLIIALLLGTYLALSRVDDLRAMAQERGQASALQLAVIVQRAVAERDIEVLQEVATLTLEEPGVRAVTILDAQRRTLASAGPRRGLSDIEVADHTLLGQHRDHVQIVQPVFGRDRFTPTITTGDGVPTTPLGWVVLQHSRAPYVIQGYQAILVAGLIIIATIIATIVFAVLASGRLERSFDALRQGIQRFESGRFDTPITLVDSDELNLLAQDINGMAQTLQNSSIDLQRTLEQTNRDLRESLETVEVQNIELDLARREAIAASRIKSEFLANTSHELRTPLNGIIGFTKLLLKSSLDARQREYLETIRYSAENLLTIINDILDFSKIEAGKLVLDNVPINLRDLIEETLSILAPSAYEKGLDLILLYDNDVPADLVGDPLRLRQILTNLISNAIKFTHAGHIAVRTSLSGPTGKRAALKISVTDTGIGLSEDQQRQLFRAFAQADASTSRVFGGTGLGLAISKRLIEQMGGEIGLDSQIGQGSTFWFSLRLPVQTNPLRSRSFDLLSGRRLAVYDSSALSLLALRQLLESWGVDVVVFEQQPATLDSEPMKSDGSVICLNAEELSRGMSDYLPGGGQPIWILIPALTTEYPEPPGARLLMKPVGHLALYDALCAALEPARLPTHVAAVEAHRELHVLAVDDNVANLKLINVLLEEQGATVATAASGRQALGLCDQHYFDLILMDLQMPELSGLQVTQLVRQGDSPNRNSRIVALTAHLLPEEQRLLLTQGFDLCLTKPLMEDQLRQLLDETATLAGGALPAPLIEAPPLPSLPAPEGDGPLARVVDVALCLRRANQKRDLANEMLAGVLQELPATRRELVAPTPEALLETVHKLHGACCYTGLPQLQQAAHELQDALKRDDSDEAIKHARDTLEQAIDALLSWQSSHDVEALFEETLS